MFHLSSYNGLKWIDSNYDDLLRARFLNKNTYKRGEREMNRKSKSKRHDKLIKNSINIQAKRYQTRKINYVPPQCDLKSSQQSPSLRQA